MRYRTVRCEPDQGHGRAMRRITVPGVWAGGAEATSRAAAPQAARGAGGLRRAQSSSRAPLAGRPPPCSCASTPQTRGGETASLACLTRLVSLVFCEPCPNGVLRTSNSLILREAQSRSSCAEGSQLRSQGVPLPCHHRLADQARPFPPCPPPRQPTRVPT